MIAYGLLMYLSGVATVLGIQAAVLAALFGRGR